MIMIGKEHYKTEQEVLEAAHGYRNRSIPVDNIVQDWHYWGSLGWGISYYGHLSPISSKSLVLNAILFPFCLYVCIYVYFVGFVKC